MHLCLSVAHVDRLYIVRITYDEDDILSFCITGSCFQFPQRIFLSDNQLGDIMRLFICDPLINGLSVFVNDGQSVAW